MTPRAARVVAICDRIVLAEMIVAIVAVVLAPVSVGLKIACVLFILFIVGVFQSRNTYVGYIPVALPNFEEQVKGLMLGGMSEEKAIAQVSRGEIAGAMFFAVITPLFCMMPIAAVYDIPQRLGLTPAVVGGIAGHASLWIVGICAAVAAIPIAMLPFLLRAKSR
jgi:hypothetical protein